MLKRLLVSAVVLVGTVLGSAAPATAAPSPSVSPSVLATLYYGYMYDDCKTEGEACTWCPRGYSCGIVHDPNVVNYRRVFYFYDCRVYAVQDWRGWGSFVNNQTDQARTTLYGRSMNVLKTVPADSRMHFYDLEPVWYVRTC